MQTSGAPCAHGPPYLQVCQCFQIENKFEKRIGSGPVCVNHVNRSEHVFLAPLFTQVAVVEHCSQRRTYRRQCSRETVPVLHYYF